ncbi:hypothetical protein ANN_13999 [Periplaneta americana]|uniref:Uncharacterized protein n=1 Tax=Periplaneta americana TaxID=6978 RepID=A0ABQ8SX83_PERAM|nr:hypothetical protein ANN_13999 [Periplaneta americana]
MLSCSTDCNGQNKAQLTLVLLHSNRYSSTSSPHLWSNGQRVWLRNQVAWVRIPVGASYPVEVFSGFSLNPIRANAGGTGFRERHCDDTPLAGQRQIPMERGLTPVSERVEVVGGRKQEKCTAIIANHNVLARHIFATAVIWYVPIVVMQAVYMVQVENDMAFVNPMLTGIYLSNKLGWEEQVTNTTRIAWKALHFSMRILKKSNRKSKELAYKTLVRPIMEYGAVGCYPYRQNQIDSIEKVQRKAAKYVKLGKGHGEEIVKDLGWELLKSRRRKPDSPHCLRHKWDTKHGPISMPD